MKQITLLLGFTFATFYSFSQNDTALINDTKNFQEDLINQYKNPATTPLDKKQLKDFKGVHFFPIDLKYAVHAYLERNPKRETIIMPTQSQVRIECIKYGEVSFEIDNKQYKLNVYQKVIDIKLQEHKDLLILIFGDATNGNETYKNGRGIDLKIPQGDSLFINFNEAYQPYSAYAEGYNCILPPIENKLPIRIEAGAKF
jgi:uncharacterized protein (DUF1684 family)